MNLRSKAKACVAAVGLVGGLAVVAAPDASATTYTWSDWRPCFYQYGGLLDNYDTGVRWEIEQTGTSRRILGFMLEGDNLVNGSWQPYFDHWTSSETIGTTPQGDTLSFYGGPYEAQTFDPTSANSMPYIGNSITAKFNIHIRQSSPLKGHECIYSHTF